MTGFEPATPCSQGRCATKLRYIPLVRIITYVVKLFNIYFLLEDFIGKHCSKCLLFKNFCFTIENELVGFGKNETTVYLARLTALKPGI